MDRNNLLTIRQHSSLNREFGYGRRDRQSERVPVAGEGGRVPEPQATRHRGEGGYREETGGGTRREAMD